MLALGLVDVIVFGNFHTWRWPIAICVANANVRNRSTVRIALLAFSAAGILLPFHLTNIGNLIKGPTAKKII